MLCDSHAMKIPCSGAMFRLPGASTLVDVFGCDSRWRLRVSSPMTLCFRAAAARPDAFSLIAEQS